MWLWLWRVKRAWEGKCVGGRAWGQGWWRAERGRCLLRCARQMQCAALRQ